jgi:hypothetical protein
MAKRKLELLSTYGINGQSYVRIKYGHEPLAPPPCAGCGVVIGEYHHPGCIEERCPACGGRSAVCPCEARG